MKHRQVEKGGVSYIIHVITFYKPTHRHVTGIGSFLLKYELFVDFIKIK